VSSPTHNFFHVEADLEKQFSLLEEVLFN